MTVNEKIKQGRQYRSMQEMKIIEDKEFMVRGYATTFDKPYLLYKTDDYEIWEQIDRRAFDNCDMSDVIMQYDHAGRVFARISNNTLSLDVDDEGLLINADLGGTELSRGLYEDISKRYITKMSFGFTVSSDEYVETRNEDGSVKVVRTILGIGKLYDVSAVSIPANDSTTISARTFVDGVIGEIEAERLQKEKRQRQKDILKLKIEIEMED